MSNIRQGNNRVSTQNCHLFWWFWFRFVEVVLFDLGRGLAAWRGGSATFHFYVQSDNLYRLSWRCWMSRPKTIVPCLWSRQAKWMVFWTHSNCNRIFCALLGLHRRSQVTKGPEAVNHHPSNHSDSTDSYPIVILIATPDPLTQFR